MPTNYAAVLPGPGQDLDIQERPYPSPGSHHVIVHVKAVAMNPVDNLIQTLGTKIFPWLKFPLVLGEDVAGEVVEIGDAVTTFKKGDRVLGHSVGLNTGNAAEGAFQTYSLVQENMLSQIPASLTFENAAGIPLALSTAISGLFRADALNLPPPNLTPRPTGKTLLVWGGSTSVGCSAIQMARAAGYEVVTTASPKNFDYLKRLGARAVYDYNSSTIRDKLIKAFEGEICGGALAIGNVQTYMSIAEICLDVVARSEGDKAVAFVTPPIDKEKIPPGIKVHFVFASAVKDNEVSKMIYGDYLPKALANGNYHPAPEPEVVGQGLGSIQKALVRLKNGVSLTKLIVSL